MRYVARVASRGVYIRALLNACPDDPKCLRDHAVLSDPYDKGLRASELVAVSLEHILRATDSEARLLTIPRHMGDQEGEGDRLAVAALGARDRCMDRARRC